MNDRELFREEEEPDFEDLDDVELEEDLYKFDEDEDDFEKPRNPRRDAYDYSEEEYPFEWDAEQEGSW